MIKNAKKSLKPIFVCKKFNIPVIASLKTDLTNFRVNFAHKTVENRAGNGSEMHPVVKIT